MTSRLVPDAINRAKKHKPESWTLDNARRCNVCDKLLPAGAQVVRVPHLVFSDGGIVYLIQCAAHRAGMAQKRIAVETICARVSVQCLRVARLLPGSPAE